MPQKPWDRHYLDHWLEKTANRELPAWVRVSLLAYGSHRANGHAPFKPGDIALVLGTVDKATGEIRPMDKSNVQREIRRAVQAGWLDDRSSSLCLVVLGHQITGGLGDPGERCDRHTRKAQQRRLRAVS